MSFLSATSAAGTGGFPGRGADVIPRDLAQGAMLGQPVRERLERQVDELVERYRPADAGPERRAGAEHAGGRGGQQPRIGIPLRVGAEPLGEALSDGSFNHRHLRGLGRAQVQVGPGLLHPAEPAPGSPPSSVSWSTTARASWPYQGEAHQRRLSGRLMLEDLAQT